MGLETSFSAANTTLMDDRSIASMYFCTGNRYPIELRAIEHSRARFRNFLARRKSVIDLFARSPREGDIAHELENAAHMPLGLFEDGSAQIDVYLLIRKHTQTSFLSDVPDLKRLVLNVY